MRSTYRTFQGFLRTFQAPIFVFLFLGGIASVAHGVYLFPFDASEGFREITLGMILLLACTQVL